jgi:NADH:ubiquinone oxidoreductase subunit E
MNEFHLAAKGAAEMTEKHHPHHPDINNEMWSQIDAVIDKNKSVSGAVITVLRECQAIAGYLPVELLDYISQGLNLPASSVYGVASFYSPFFHGTQGPAHHQDVPGDRMLCQRH